MLLNPVAPQCQLVKIEMEIVAIDRGDYRFYHQTSYCYFESKNIFTKTLLTNAELAVSRAVGLRPSIP